MLLIIIIFCGPGGIRTHLFKLFAKQSVYHRHQAQIFHIHASVRHRFTFRLRKSVDHHRAGLLVPPPFPYMNLKHLYTGFEPVNPRAIFYDDFRVLPSIYCRIPIPPI